MIEYVCIVLSIAHGFVNDQDSVSKRFHITIAPATNMQYILLSCTIEAFFLGGVFPVQLLVLLPSASYCNRSSDTAFRRRPKSSFPLQT